MNWKKINWKKILSVMLWTQLLVLICILLGFVNKEENQMPCHELNILVDNSATGINFVEPDDIRELIRNKAIVIIGTPMENIHTGLLEKMLNENPYIFNAEVFTTIDGTLQIDVKQRKPLLRVINALGENYYVDEKGSKMPLSEKYFARVLVATGNIRDSYLAGILHPVTENKDSVHMATLSDSLFVLAQYIRNNEFLNALTEQINVNSDHEFELIPKVGRHIIVVGDISGLEDKFSRLIAFYKKGLLKSGLDTYSVLNLKFRDQVVCTRNPE